MVKTRNKPVTPAPSANRPTNAPPAGKSNARFQPQADKRWQRTKRYGWDGR